MKTSPLFQVARRGFTLIELMVVITILAVLASVSYGPIMDQINQGDRALCMQNMGQVVKFGMGTFSNDVGSYPDDSTADSLTERDSELDYGPLTGISSNCYLRQLLFSGAISQEKNFYAKISCDAGVTRDPDGAVANGKALEPGECGFAYVMLEDGGAINPNDSSAPPLLMASVIHSANGDSLTFDDQSFREYVIIARTDGSTQMTKIAPDKSGAYIMPNLFKEDRRGNSTADKYKVLAPELQKKK